MIPLFLKQLIHLGVRQDCSDENQLTILYNKMALFSFIFLFSFSIYLFIADIPKLYSFITFGISLIYGLVLVFNGLNKIYWARFITSFGTVVWVSIYHICFSGFFSQSLAVGAAIIINYVAFRKKAEHMKLLFAIHAGVYLIALGYGINFEPLVELVDYPLSGLVSFIVSMAWVTLFLIVFHREREDLIERLKKKNSELKRTSEELERFNYIASHDLKSPLRTIISFGGMIQSDIEKENFDSINEKMDFLVSGARQMNYIVEGILELSQVKNINEADRSEVDLNEVLEKVKLNLSGEIKTSNAIIRTEQLPIFFCNEIEFLLIFQNFIQNAIKYNQNETPTVDISFNLNDERLFLSFKDNGIGIDEKYFEQIFEFFKRLHNVSEYPGTGIGLGICKRIVDNYEGSIAVDSKIGKGTVFSLNIPVTKNKIIGSSEEKELFLLN